MSVIISREEAQQAWNDRAVTEAELAKRAVAPRISQEDVDDVVYNAYYHIIPDSMMTICALILRNGYTVIGKAACVSAANFRKDIGERIAREDAYGQVWALLGYALADRLHGAKGWDVSRNTFVGAPPEPFFSWPDYWEDAIARQYIEGLHMSAGARPPLLNDAERMEFIARLCHEVNRGYCAALGDLSQKAWAEAPEWQRESARMGVDLHLMGDFGPEASHISWMKEKERTGWKYGPVKDEAKKEHHCMVPFDQLPREQQAKDYIFRAVVHALK